MAAFQEGILSHTTGGLWPSNIYERNDSTNTPFALCRESWLMHYNRTKQIVLFVIGLPRYMLSTFSESHRSVKKYPAHFHKFG